MINPEKQQYKNFKIEECPWVIEHLEEKPDMKKIRDCLKKTKAILRETLK